MTVAPGQARFAQPLAPPPGYVLVPIGSTGVYSDPSRGQSVPARELDYHDGEPVPAGYSVVERPRRGLIIGGALTLGVPWVFSATAAVGADFEDKSGFLLIPAIGPWLMLATGGAGDQCSPYVVGGSSCERDNRAGVRALLFLDGVTQTAGAVMLAFGLSSTTKRLIRNELSLSVLPTRVGTDGYGFGARGTF